MNNKRLLAIVLALCLVLGLCACGNGESGKTDAEETQPQSVETPVVKDEKPEEDVQETEASGLVYTVKVQDEGGNPIAGAMVQMCEGTNCVPARSDDAGVATFNVQAEADYEVKFMMLPEGFDYTGEEQVFHFDAGSYEMTITLKAVA